MKACTSDVGVKNSTKVITKLQRSKEKPIRKSCNDTGQKKQQLDIFGLCSHALGLARSWHSWQQSEHKAVRTPGFAFALHSRHPAMDGGPWVFTCTSSPCHSMWLNHAHRFQ